MTPARRNRERLIDWDDARRRLAQSAMGMEDALRLSPERARQLMDERARELARVSEEPRPAGEMIEVLTFALGNEAYAIESRYVHGVARFTDFTPVPGAPEFVLGVTNLRGEVLAVIDLHKFFGVAAKGMTDLSRLVVLGSDRAELGVLADATDEVRALRSDEVLDAAEPVAGIGRSYLRGVTRDALIVLDGAVLLGDGRLFVDQLEGSRNLNGKEGSL